MEGWNLSRQGLRSMMSWEKVCRYIPDDLPNILRNLVGRKATRRYPAQRRAPFKGARGELVNEMEKCTLCGVCAAKCPPRFINVDKGVDTGSCDPLACLSSITELNALY